MTATHFYVFALIITLGPLFLLALYAIWGAVADELQEARHRRELRAWARRWNVRR